MNERLGSVVDLAKRCTEDMEHAMQVTRLSLEIFDQMKDIHGMDEKEREILKFAALLHDIGWVEGQKRHHKTSMRIIMEDRDLLLEDSERTMVGLVARYHRKAMPSMKHDYYGTLPDDKRAMVDLLAAILRIADGLDFNHMNAVNDLSCSFTLKKINILCSVSSNASAEAESAMIKGDLMEKAFGRKLDIKWKFK